MDMLTLMTVAVTEPDRGTAWLGTSTGSPMHECASCALRYLESGISADYRVEVLTATVFLKGGEYRKCNACKCLLATTPME